MTPEEEKEITQHIDAIGDLRFLGRNGK